MTNIKPISDLRNYTDVLHQVTEGNPVYLTKNGHGEYVILKLEDLDKLKATVKLLSELQRGEESVRQKGWLTAEQVEAELGI